MRTRGVKGRVREIDRESRREEPAFKLMKSPDLSLSLVVLSSSEQKEETAVCETGIRINHQIIRGFVSLAPTLHLSEFGERGWIFRTFEDREYF